MAGAILSLSRLWVTAVEGNAMNIDPFRLEVVKSALDSIVDEMALVIMRSAYSGIVRDAMDYSTAICDARGRTLAQGLTTPLHLGGFFDAMSALIARFADDVYDEDLFIFNDPYVASGQHLPDIYIIKPVFLGSRLKGWATTVAHHNDVGGVVPGSNSLGARDIYGEGLRLPLLKLRDRGRDVQPILEILKLNVRVPIKVMGDLHAQIAACNVAERSLKELYDRYGEGETDAYLEAVHNYAERLARAEIEEIPDGVYCFENWIDGLGSKPIPIPIRVSLTVHGDSVTVDWSGSGPQVEAGINSPMPFTRAATYTALRSIMSSEVPNSEGFTRPITVRAPARSVVNPDPPSACGARGVTGFRMIDCLMGALAQAVPARVPADGNGGATLLAIGGWQASQAFVFVEAMMGNSGASDTHDGQSAVSHIGANQSNIPIEMIEAEYPLRVERYEFVPDSGGPGRYRGGLAMRRDFRLLAERAQLTIRSDKRRHRPFGLDGGQPGQPSMNLINPDGTQVVLPVMLLEPWTMQSGDVISHELAGAGGYGCPFDREPELVVEDVRLGLVSTEAAARDYGVVVTAGRPPCLDAEETKVLRARLRAEGAVS